MRRRRRNPVIVALVVVAGALLVILRAWRPSRPRFAPSRGTVRRVVDGDTFHLTNGARVRLLEIDAPERGGASPELGEAARRALEALVKGREVRLEAGGRVRDRYDRFLCYAFVRASGGDARAARDRDGPSAVGPVVGPGVGPVEARPPGEIFVEAEIVRLGLARARTWGPPGPHFDEILAAEREAKEAMRGMWAGGGEPAR